MSEVSFRISDRVLWASSELHTMQEAQGRLSFGDIYLIGLLISHQVYIAPFLSLNIHAHIRASIQFRITDVMNPTGVECD